MSEVWSVDGQALALNAVIAETMIVKLFKNDFVPLVTSDVADYVEATFPGYSSQPIGVFADPEYDAITEQSTCTAPLLTWTQTSGSAQNIYGYYVTSSDGSLVYFAQRGDYVPIVMSAGNSMSVLPQITVGDL